MNSVESGEVEEERRTPGNHRRPTREGVRVGGLHPVIHAIVVLVLLALLVYNVVAVGPEGYPTSVIIGGLLGAYAGLNELLKRKGGG